MKNLIASFLFFALCPLPLTWAADKFVTPYGAGLKNGSSYQDAYDASSGGLQKCADNVGPGDTCHIGPGTYKNTSLRISSGGKNGIYKKIIGDTTSAGEKPLFIGNWKKEAPKTGRHFITILSGVDYLWLQNLEISNYQESIRSTRTGRNDFLRILDIDIRETRVGIELYGDSQCHSGPIGSASCPNPQNASHDLVIENVTVTHATRLGIRLRYGVYDAVLKNCLVDMGGKAYDLDPSGDMVAFSLGDGSSARHDSPDRNITYIDCTAKNAYADLGEEYWQGDGFKSEDYSTGVRYIRCGAFDNTDGGFDVKGPGTILTDCVAARNKRNFRLWNVGRTNEGRAVLTNCLGHHAKYWGDKKHAVVNLHLFGGAVVRHSTFHNVLANDEAPSYIILQDDYYYPAGGFTTEIIDSIYSSDKNSPETTVLKKIAAQYEAVSVIHEMNTESWDGRVRDAGGFDPEYLNPSSDFEGGGDAFNNRRYGKKRGFYREALE